MRTNLQGPEKAEGKTPVSNASSDGDARNGHAVTAFEFVHTYTYRIMYSILCTTRGLAFWLGRRRRRIVFKAHAYSIMCGVGGYQRQPSPNNPKQTHARTTLLGNFAKCTAIYIAYALSPCALIHHIHKHTPIHERTQNAHTHTAHK